MRVRKVETDALAARDERSGARGEVCSGKVARTDARRCEIGQLVPRARELSIKMTKIELQDVSDENLVAEVLHDCSADVVELRCVVEHLASDAMYPVRANDTIVVGTNER